MDTPISYRPAIGKRKLERIVISKLHYKNMNQFIDHAVSVVLSDEVGTNTTIRKITHEIERVITKHVPLNFINANEKEARELEESINGAKKKGGWISTKELMKKHNIS